MRRLPHSGFRVLLAGAEMGFAVLGTVPILLVATGATARSQDLFIWELAGAAGGDGFGRSVARAGDVDGDGIPDIVVGAPQGPTAPGYARVYSGASGALLLTLTGAAAGDRFGWSVSSAGDVDGDGSDDVIVGAPSSTVPTFGIGYARVVSGATGSTLLTLAGNTTFEEFGFAVAGMGDVDGDATPDVAVGAPNAWNGTGCDSGEVRLHSGASGASLYTISGAGTALGYSVASAGDLDGDSVPDVIVGAPLTPVPAPGCNGWSGAAFLYSGATGSPLLGIGPFVGAGDSFLGGCVGPAGDVNGDGTADLFVGSAAPAGSPVVWACSGIDGTLLSIFSMSGSLGLSTINQDFSVADLGDVDGDGLPDAAIAVPGFCATSCGTTIGTCCGNVAVVSFASSNPIGGFLSSSSDVFTVAAAGDLDGDGRTDLLIGDSEGGLCPVGSATGRVRVVSMLAPRAQLWGFACVSGGTACLPLIGTTGGPPATGNSAFGIRASNVLGGTAVVLVAGATFLSPPIALPFGGCDLLVTPDVLVGATASGTGPGNGSVAVGIPIPAAPALVGQPAYFQWYVVDPGPALLPGALSQMLLLWVL
ncbi:MAG: FG-GAP-like repeat-containing protein [Planctomycetes bacterium]|nr:FG-GAP-like repeat-containing protein [Planctomycetota bacterium]